MIKLALTDLDDTFTVEGMPATPRAMAAMHAMLDAGLHVGPVSGRMHEAMSWMMHGDEACYATGAFANGMQLFVDGELVREEAVPTEQLERVLAVCDESGFACVATYDVSGPSATTIVTHLPLPETSVVRTFVRVDALRSSFEESAYVKVNVQCDTRDMSRVTALRDRLSAEVPEVSFVLPSPHMPMIDLTPAGWGKGAAALALADALGIGHDEVAVFGDSENDLDMIRTVPNSVAVANAMPEVRAAARWHIGPAAEDAVAAAFEQMARAARTGSMPAFMR